MTKAPWNHPIVRKLEHLPKVRPTFDTAVKRVRNRLRRYRVDSIVQCALNQLHDAQLGSRMDELKTWPWLSCLLVKLILEDKTIAIDRGEACTPYAFQYCLQTLWDVQSSRERKDEAPGNVYRMIRSISQGQFVFQGRPTWDFLRWPALIARLPADHECHRQFTERFGVDPKAFMLIVYAAHIPVLNNRGAINLADFAPLRKNLGSSFDRVLSEFSRSASGLREELQTCRQAARLAGPKARPHHELNEPPWLMNYPLLRVSNESLVVWHPAVFNRGMEQIVHRRLSERGGEYAQKFGRVFERYVVEQIDDSGLTYLSEEAYWAAVGKDKNAMEAVICQDEFNVLVDAKLTIYSEDVALNTQAPVVWKALKRVREAMNQAWNVSARLRQPGLPNWPCTKAREDFLIVVTSQPVYCATGEHFRRIFKHDIFDPGKLATRKQSTPTEEQLGYLPLGNVMIASIAEWEQLMGCVARGYIDIVPFLREVAKANKDVATSVMFLGQILEEKVNEQILSSLIKRSRDDNESELIKMLGNANRTAY